MKSLRLNPLHRAVTLSIRHIAFLQHSCHFPVLFLPTFGVCLQHFSYALSPAFCDIEFCARGAVFPHKVSVSELYHSVHANESCHSSAYLPFSLTFSIPCLCFCCDSQCAVAVCLNIHFFCSSRGPEGLHLQLVTSEAKGKDTERVFRRSLRSLRECM